MQWPRYTLISPRQSQDGVCRFSWSGVLPKSNQCSWLPEDFQAAASHLDTFQKAACNTGYRQCSIQTQGVPNSPFQGLSEYPPPPPTKPNSAVTNEAAMASIPENILCWHNRVAPERDFYGRFSGGGGDDKGCFAIKSEFFPQFLKFCHEFGDKSYGTSPPPPFRILDFVPFI